MEKWPSDSGHVPSFETLTRLAELYECAVSDLVNDLPDHREFFQETDRPQGRSLPRPTDQPIYEATTRARAATMPKSNPEPNRPFWQARMRLNLSRSQLANDANREPVMRTCQHAPMDENYIGRIEQGRISGGTCTERLTAICARLGVTDPAEIGLTAERRHPTRSGPTIARQSEPAHAPHAHELLQSADSPPTMFRLALEEQHLQTPKAFRARYVRAAHELADREADPEFRKQDVSPRQFQRWLDGQRPRPYACRIVEHLLNRPIGELLQPASERQTMPTAVKVHEPEPEPAAIGHKGEEIDSRQADALRVEHDNSETSLPPYHAVSNLRQKLNASLETAIVAEITVEHWQTIADGYGRVYRVSPPMSFLADVAPDVSELTTIIDQRLSSKERRALCRCTAQMAGLLATTFVNLNEFREARAWFNTAMRAAEESEDVTLEAWVMVRHAVSALYWDDPFGALDLAARAAEMTSGVDCVATAWAPAVLARAYSRLGPDYFENVRTSITQAEKQFGKLSVSPAGQHAYGYTAAQLHFYRSNALTEIGETKAAFDAQQSALSYYGPTAFLDPSLIRLDRAVCLAKDGDSEAAANFAVKSLESLPREHISPIIALRARELVSVIPVGQRGLPAVRALANSLSSEIAPSALPGRSSS